MAKKTIKLTESELHNIIKESVKKVLKEGQGWDTFKKGLRDGNNNNTNKHSDVKQSFKNFVNTGDIEGRGLRYYHPNNPTVSTTYKDGAKEIDRSTMGKIGRASGVAGGMGAKLAKTGAQKIGKALKQGASAVGEKASDFARSAKSRMIKNQINRQSRNNKNNGNGDYDSFTM